MFSRMLGLALLASGCTSAPPGSTPMDASPPEMPATVRPVSSAEDRAASAGWRGGGTWLDQHDDINRLGASRRVDVVFLGDSITQSWGGDGRDVWAPGAAAWETHFAQVHPANFGISGDRTQHILWRIDHGNFDAVRPTAVVLLIGTNNIGHDPPEAIALGIEAVVDRLQRVAPKATIVVLAILPRGEMPDDLARLAVERTNELVRPLGARPGVVFLDPKVAFLREDGRADPALYGGDFLHLSVAGYETLGASISPVLGLAR